MAGYDEIKVKYILHKSRELFACAPMMICAPSFRCSVSLRNILKITIKKISTAKWKLDFCHFILTHSFSIGCMIDCSFSEKLQAFINKDAKTEVEVSFCGTCYTDVVIWSPHSSGIRHRWECSGKRNKSGYACIIRHLGIILDLYLCYSLLHNEEGRSNPGLRRICHHRK